MEPISTQPIFDLEFEVRFSSRYGWELKYSDSMIVDYSGMSEFEKGLISRIKLNTNSEEFCNWQKFNIKIDHFRIG